MLIGEVRRVDETDAVMFDGVLFNLCFSWLCGSRLGDVFSASL